MRLHLLKNREPFGWASFGGYWPRGEVRADVFTLRDGQGQPVPVQSEIAARWPDGSVKWSRHTASAALLGQGGELEPEDPAAGSRHTAAENLPGEGSERAAAGLRVTETGEGWRITGGRLDLTVPKEGNTLAVNASLDGKAMFREVRPVLSLCHETERNGSALRETVPCDPVIERRAIEAAGPLEVTVRFDGIHREDGEEKMPFRIRMSVRDDGSLTFDHTFFFRGDPERDRLAGWGLRTEAALSGTSWQRRIRMLTDRGLDHDAPTQLFYWRKHLDPALLADQMAGAVIPETEELKDIAADLPRWDHFLLLQDSASHCAIRKKAWEGGCWVEGIQGRRSPGGMAVNDPERTLCFHIRDFWEKHPAGLECEGLSGDAAACTAWFYAPQAEPFDFRHYDRRTYPSGTYEGFDYMGADPNGVAVTCTLGMFLEAGPVSDEDFRRQNRAVRKPPVYLAEPAYYHRHRAFGLWSLPDSGTETGAWIEKQIDAACEFYRREADARSWYGLFNYGDLMHTYEPARHQWRYDVGGYAWDNTELAPTYWLWLQALRTGDEKVFSMAEALSRHAADVDMYHFGPRKGLGSRHNVRHWGCPCKEPRISMAGHHRPLYYLTGNRRIGDCMEDALTAAESLAAAPWFTGSGQGITVRTGPDWAALVSDWMTAWERTLEPKWKRMIENGLADLAGAPLGLTSGPIFGFDPETGHLTYRGEAETPTSMHLQACMGETEVWLETAEALPAPALKRMVADNGRYFWLSPEERMRASGGLLEGRSFQSPIYSAEMQAWAAKSAGNADMARDIWRALLALLYSPDKPEGFAPAVYEEGTDGTGLREIPWITTNFTAQWCLKAIVCLDLIPEAMPATLSELEEALREKPSAYRLYGA